MCFVDQQGCKIARLQVCALHDNILIPVPQTLRVYKLCLRDAVVILHRYPRQDDWQLPLHLVLPPDYYVVQSMPKSLVLQRTTS